jgi:hypothetical protein
MFEHLLQARWVFRHVHVLHGDFALAVLLTGGGSVGSGVFAKDKNRVSHQCNLLDCWG